MVPGDETCWTMIQGAAEGNGAARSLFAHNYLDVVRAYLGARWRGNPLIDRLDDAVQDVFLDCFRTEGALGRLDRSRSTSFRTFLYGVVRNIALRYEERAGTAREAQLPSAFDPETLTAREDQLSVVFDKAWARAILTRAGQRHAAWAEQQGEAGMRRLELLRMRFGAGKPIRDIAVEWDMPAERLHAEYRKAREEFKRALREEVAFHHPGAPASLDRECEKLLSLLK